VLINSLPRASPWATVVAVITPIDVVDSAVKIGLGAIISGLATYWLAKANHNKTIEKERSQRKRDTLEGIAQQVATFDDLTGKYLRRVRLWLANESEPMSETERSDLTRLQASIYEASNQLTGAETKLLLLGEVKCNELLKEYWDSLVIHRIESIAARDFTAADVWEYREQLLQKRDELLKEIGKVYRTIQ
jgi:hypothetical protein